MPDDQTVSDFLVDQARVSEHVTALILLLVKKEIIAGAEYEAALQQVWRRGSWSRTSGKT